MELNTLDEKRSRTRVKTHEDRFIWTAENIRNCPIKTGEDYTSPSFLFGKTKAYECMLDVYLNGVDDDCYVGILPRLRERNDQTNVAPFFEDFIVEISILDEKESAIATKRAYYSRHDFTSENSNDVFKNIVKKIDLLKLPSFSIRGDLKVMCSIFSHSGYSGRSETIEEDVALTAATHDKINEHLADFEKLLFNSEFSDFQLIIGDTKIPVHRAILAARSRVFSAMLSNDMLEKNNGSVSIEDVDVEVMHELLRFVYVGRVFNLDKIADKILIAADKYDLTALKQICENTLVAKLSCDTIFEILQLVDRHDAVTLKKATIDYVMKNAKKLAAKDDFDECMKQLSPELSVQVMRSLIAKT